MGITVKKGGVAVAVAAAATKAPSSILIYTTLVIVQFVFSLWAFVAKYAMSHVKLPPMVFASYREVIATLILLLLARCCKSKSSNEKEVTWNDLKRHSHSLVLMGFLMFVNISGFIIGLNMVTTFNASILQPTQPVFAALIAWICGYETMSLLKGLSIILACSGAALTVWLNSVIDTTSSSSAEEVSHRSLGNAILLVECIAAGALWVLQKRVLADIPSPIVLTAATYTVASVFTIALTMAMTEHLQDAIIVTSWEAWACIGYASLFATVFAYYALGWANKWANPSTVTISLSLQPLFTATINALRGGPPLVPPQILSCGLIVVGLALKVYDQERITTTTRNKNKNKIVDATKNTNDLTTSLI